jgi:hypothetical protein
LAPKKSTKENTQQEKNLDLLKTPEIQRAAMRRARKDLALEFPSPL